MLYARAFGYTASGLLERERVYGQDDARGAWRGGGRALRIDVSVMLTRLRNWWDRITQQRLDTDDERIAYLRAHKPWWRIFFQSYGWLRLKVVPSLLFSLIHRRSLLVYAFSVLAVFLAFIVTLSKSSWENLWDYFTLPNLTLLILLPLLLSLVKAAVKFALNRSERKLRDARDRRMALDRTQVVNALLGTSARRDQTNQLSAKDQRALRRLLRAIASEAKRYADGAYEDNTYNATLLVFDDRKNQATILARASVRSQQDGGRDEDINEPAPSKTKKEGPVLGRPLEGILAYYAALSGQSCRIDDFFKQPIVPVQHLWRDDKTPQYRSVFFLPCMERPPRKRDPSVVPEADGVAPGAGGDVPEADNVVPRRCLGVVSIDTARPYAFWGGATNLTIRISFYERLLSFLLFGREPGVAVREPTS